MPAIDHSRRALLRGRPGNRIGAVLPPWAVGHFFEACSRCNECVDACEENVLVRGDGGFPNLDFDRGGCSFCEACVRSCSRKALDIQQGRNWPFQARIEQGCLSANGVVCRTCSDVCEERAIKFQIFSGAQSRPVLDDQVCNGCGACISVCPGNAIRLERAA